MREQNPAIPFRRPGRDDGIQVKEVPLRTVNAQLMYRLRCECGRSWFDLVQPTIVHCPACGQAGLVSASVSPKVHDAG